MDQWLAANWAQVLTLAGTLFTVLKFALKTQAAAAASQTAVETLAKKFDEHAAFTNTKINELERALAQLTPRQRDMERIDRDVDKLEQKVARLAESMARIGAARRRQLDDEDRDSGEIRREED